MPPPCSLRSNSNRIMEGFSAWLGVFKRAISLMSTLTKKTKKRA
jgi:hypothetical protein